MSDHASGPPTEIQAHFVKSNFFRVVHADGAWGGVTPQLKIHMDIYNERQPIPRSMRSRVVGDRIGEEIRDAREGKEGVVREVEVGVVMDVVVAEQVVAWLTERIALARKLMSEVQKEGAENV